MDEAEVVLKKAAKINGKEFPENILHSGKVKSSSYFAEKRIRFNQNSNIYFVFLFAIYVRTIYLFFLHWNCSDYENIVIFYALA